MTTPTSTEATATATTTPKDLGELSFTDYQKVRRGEAIDEVEATSAPAEQAEQKPATESEPVEPEAKEEDKDESDEDEVEAKSDESEKDDKPKKKGGFQRRIDKLNARYAEKEREAEYWRQQALKSAGAPEQKPTEMTQKAPTVEASDKPKAENFETQAEFIEALTEWKVEQKQKAAQAEQEKQKLLTQHETLQRTYAERFKAFTDKTEDAVEVLESLADVPRSQTVEDLILSSENGPELLYELAKNPEEAKRICSLPPTAAAREFGKFEAKVLSAKAPVQEQKKPEPKTLTKAPKPIEPVGTVAKAVRKSVYDEDLPFEEYERLRRDQMRRKA
jgi:hypothetical protein